MNSSISVRFFDKQTSSEDLPKYYSPEVKFLSLNQVHGSEIYSADRLPNENERPKCDGAVSSLENLALTIHTADCLPLLAHDDEIIGACHAGWRGLSQNIVENWIGRLSSMGTSKNNIKVYVGPSIGPCHFEVEKEVTTKIVSPKEFPVKFLKIFVKPHPDPRKDFVDLREVTRFKLLRLGVLEAHIQISNECTFCNPKLYHSYRRDGAKPGRLEAVIVKSPR